jgi:hypothetical protein
MLGKLRDAGDVHESKYLYLLRPADGKLSPCKISHTVLGTLQPHSSSSFHTANIQSQNFQSISFVNSITTSTNAEPLCHRPLLSSLKASWQNFV